MIGTRLVPMSELLSAEATLTRTCFVFDLCLDPISAELQVATVACHVGGLGMIDRGLVVFLVGSCSQPILLRMPRLAMTSALSVWLTALISDSAVDVEMLPWSVEHQHMSLPARYPR